MTDQPAIPLQAEDYSHLLGELPGGTKYGGKCPHCTVPGRIRTSSEVTVTFRKIYYECLNPLCGHEWVASLSYDYGIVPSAIPNPNINLPLRPPERRAVMQGIADARAADPDPDQPTLFAT